jgi:hypothetical protein
MDLVPGKEYYIQTHDGKYFKGMKFHDYKAYNSSRPLYDYVDMIFQRTTYFYLFDELDYYYDPEKIREKAQLAKQSMEQRALDMILKKVVNEEFQW